MTKDQRTQIEAAAFRGLMKHLQERRASTESIVMFVSQKISLPTKRIGLADLNEQQNIDEEDTFSTLSQVDNHLSLVVFGLPTKMTYNVFVKKLQQMHLNSEQ